METIIIIAVLVAFVAWRLKPVKGVQNVSTAQLKTMLNDKDKIACLCEYLTSVIP